jgi:hypothetical protein
MILFIGVLSFSSCAVYQRSRSARRGQPHEGGQGRQKKVKTTQQAGRLSRKCSIPVVEQKQQDHHNNDNPQEFIVIPVKKTVKKTHGGVPLSFSLQPMQLTRRVSVAG